MQLACVLGGQDDGKVLSNSSRKGKWGLTHVQKRPATKRDKENGDKGGGNGTSLTGARHPLPVLKNLEARQNPKGALAGPKL